MDRALSTYTLTPTTIRTLMYLPTLHNYLASLSFMELLRRSTVSMLSLESIKQYLLTNNIDQVVTKMNRYVCVALF